MLGCEKGLAAAHKESLPAGPSLRDCSPWLGPKGSDLLVLGAVEASIPWRASWAVAPFCFGQLQKGVAREVSRTGRWNLPFLSQFPPQLTVNSMPVE